VLVVMVEVMDRNHMVETSEGTGMILIMDLMQVLVVMVVVMVGVPVAVVVLLVDMVVKLQVMVVQVMDMVVGLLVVTVVVLVLHVAVVVVVIVEGNLDMVMIMELLHPLVKVVMEPVHLLRTTTLHLQVLLDQEVMVPDMVVVKVAMVLVVIIMPHHVEVRRLEVEDVTGIERPSTFYNVLAKLRNCGLVQFIGLICGPRNRI